MRFFGNDGEEAGRIWVNEEGGLSFEGKATATAELFLEEVMRIWNQQIEYVEDEQ